ncbi:MAG: type II toxin-antitoxin system prevent-host-death family antitoxin [Bacillota bacterium]|jgi:prevent-host-death family protein|nr:type II toxin-antitoxin system prevent-host-death family antitoxin [Bacillota bacterium]
MEVGIREIKNRFSWYLQRVKKGEVLIITERNTPVAKLIPMQTPPDVLNLLDTGLVCWKGGKPQGLIEPPSIQGTKTIAEIVAEDRR